MSADVVVTTLQLADGTTGSGFNATIGGDDDRALTAALYILDRFVAGKPMQHPLALWRAVDAELGRNGDDAYRAALASIDVALWDMYAVTLGVPIGIAMGGAPRRIPVYGSGGFKRGGDPDEAVARARDYQARGARGVKVRAGGTTADAPLLEAVARSLTGIELMIDANGHCTPASAAQLLRDAAGVNARFVEEPLPPSETAAYAALARSAPVPIATGENLRGIAETAPYLFGHWCSVIQPDLTVMGGLSECLRTAQLAEHLGIETAPHFLPGLFIQLAAAVPNLTWLEDFPTIEPLFSRMPAMDADGYMTLPELPGHGLVFADGARAAFRIA
jgi:L-alanine-DL-glutamate epimerase-like enolase superfamily enzyme